MPGLEPGIHVLQPIGKQDVDGRDKSGHDGKRFAERRDALIFRAEQAMKTVIEKDGEHLCLVLPQEALSELGWTSGDILDLKVEANCLRAVRSMTKHEFAMAMARRAFARYRETFEALAKS